MTLTCFIYHNSVSVCVTSYFFYHTELLDVLKVDFLELNKHFWINTHTHTHAHTYSQKYACPVENTGATVAVQLGVVIGSLLFHFTSQNPNQVILDSDTHHVNCCNLHHIHL